jgi:hypothetical protein
MNIGVSPVDTSYVIIGGLALLVAVPLSLAAIGLLARLLAWIFKKIGERLRPATQD